MADDQITDYRYTREKLPRGQTMQTDPDDITMTVLRIELPEYVPPTGEELKRRQELAARIDELREKIGPIGIQADELKHQARNES
jgi:hypothetical protein